MPWKLVWTARAEGDLHRLDSPVRRQVLARLARAMDDPARHFKRLKASTYWSLRAGGQRILALVIIRETTVIVRRIGDRSVVYDR